MVSTPDPKHSDYRTTGGMALAAYAHMNGMRIVKAEEFRRGRVTEYLFTVHDPDGKWDQLCIDYANSEAQKHDASVRTLKRLCKHTVRNNG